MELIPLLFMALMSFICMLIGFIVYVIALILWTHSKYDHLPGPKRSSFWFGNALDVYKTVRKSNEDYIDEAKTKLKPTRHEKFAQWAEEYGDTYVLFVFHRAFIVTRSPTVIKTVLVTADPRDFPKLGDIPVRNLYGVRFMGDSLGTEVDHDSWHDHRKKIDPMFRRNQLRLSVDGFNSTADQLMDELREYTESGESLQLTHHFNLSTIDVIMKTMFSIDAASLGTDFHKQTQEFVRETFIGMETSLIPFATINPYLHQHRTNVRKTIKSFREIGARMIDERKELITNGEAVPDDLLTRLVNSLLDPSLGYTYDSIVDEFATMIVGGVDTSANAISFIFMELGRRPDLLKRLVDEVDEVVGKKPFISNEDITKLPFMATLIKESVRLYPPVPIIARHVRKEVILDGLRIPANSALTINLFGANRHDRYLERADEFVPERFDPGQETKVPMLSFTSFSLGQRSCIGKFFVQMELKVMIAKFFQQYEFTLDDSENFEIAQAGTTAPLSGVKCTLRARQ